MLSFCATRMESVEGMKGSGSREKRARKRRSRTISRRHLSRINLAEGVELDEDLDLLRPKTRGDCINGPRPCPWVGCKYHLYLDVNEKTGSIILNFPDLMPWELEHSCVLDVADRGGITLEEVGAIMNLTRERIRQLESLAASKLRENDLVLEFRDLELDE